MRKRALVISVLILGFVVMAYQYCSLPSRSVASGPFFQLKFKFSNLSMNQISDIRSLTFCFAQIKFIPYVDLNNPDPNAVTQKFDFNIDDVEYDANGTSLTYVSLPAGKYQTIQLILGNQCSSARSLQLTNSNGIFSTTNAITMTLDGAPTYLDINDSTTQVTLNVDNIVLALRNVTANTQIQTTVESNHGTF